MMNNRDNLAINAIRYTSASMITKAKSGHPGICLGSASLVHTLFTRFLNVCKNDAFWPNRDRFVLSAGHGSAMLYTLLHIAGFPISMQDLKEFRQKGSKTPGHPEYRHTPGVEVTTGPLAQGLATAVGFAIAEKHLEARYNKEDLKIFDYNTYVLCGDGDLQEGLAMEACSLAGTLKLDNLVLLFDSNDIQLDGPTYKAVADDIKMKFEAMNWSYFKVEDGNDIKALSEALNKAQEANKPSIIEVKTIIGYGAPTAGSNAVHGKPLSEEELAILKNNLAYPSDSFVIPDDVYALYRETLGTRSQLKYDKFKQDLILYASKYKDDYQSLEAYLNDKEYDFNLLNYDKAISTRKVAGQVLTACAAIDDRILAGSADLASSSMIKGNDGDFSSSNYLARNINYGVREHAMASIINGLTLSKLRGVGGGFFVFSDYLKDSIRQAAIMQISSLFVFSHDTVCVGEDGPTHQPVEQLAGLRAMPNLNVVRPADAKETSYAIKEALKNNTYPTVITTSRQDLAVLEETNYEGFKKGAYICYEPKAKVEAIIISCGSELALALEAAKQLDAKSFGVRVVSMPSEFIFRQQDKAYQEKVLPANITKRLAVEMGASQPWYRYARKVLGIDTFGASMPIKEIYAYYGFSVDHIIELIKEL